MNIRERITEIILTAALLLVSTVSSRAFALLGPLQPWMQATNSLVYPTDVGGPMPIGCGYRWNVPVVTYGFDQSFLDFFGTNGVAAVESAIKIINDLPAASNLVLTNFPFDSRQLNSTTQGQALLDLKSQVLPLLLEQLGLAQPTRNIYVTKNWNPVAFNGGSGNIYITGMPIFYERDPSYIDPAASLGSPGNLPYFVTGLNFDPKTIAPSDSVNNTEYAGWVFIQNLWPQYIIPYPVNPQIPWANRDNAVADDSAFTGTFYTGLTYDDIGGLAYLLSTNTVNFEYLIPGVTGAGTNASSFVNGARRPGVEKVTFIPQRADPQSGLFLLTTNYYTDTYISNGISTQQQLMRVIPQPDFLFSADDAHGTGLAYYTCTGSTNWQNNSAANDNSNRAGPGVIVPSVHVILNKLGRYLAAAVSEDQAYDESYFWGSYNASTNAPMVYPVPQNGPTQSIIRMGISVDGTVQLFNWSAGGSYGAQYAFQTSTNWVAWTTLFTITNSGTVNWYENFMPKSSSRFYRLAPQ